MEKIRGKHLFQVLDDELEKVALEWHTNNIDDNPFSQGVFRVSDIEIIFRKLLEEYIEQEISKAREEVERKFVEKYHKRGEEMNVPYSEEDGKEFWQGYKEGYNQGLKDMIVDTYYLDKEFELKLKQ